MTLIEALRLLVTQIEPSGAMASERGAVPTANSASGARDGVERGDAVVVGLTTHRRAWRQRGFKHHAEDIAGRSLRGRCTLCKRLALLDPGCRARSP